MKEILITEADIDAVVAWIEEHSDHIHISRPEDFNPSAVKVIHCVLSLRTSYYKVVKPRLESFMLVHPGITQVTDLMV